MAGHGSVPLRGLEQTGQSTIQKAKFGRMFRWLEPAITAKNAKERLEIEDLLKHLAGLMVAKEFVKNIGAGKSTPDTPLTQREPDDENPTIPAGYTYFGQFVDHDITFDPASSLQQTNDPDALVDFRTPRFDLDNIYGRGSADQPYLYEKPDRVKFILGANRGISGMDRPDLQRTADGTALIGDKRNDENKIVVQFQALFLKFHNKIYDKLASKFSKGQEADRFAEAQRIVRWCYQWIVLTDFLPRVCDKTIVDSIRPDTTGHSGPKLNFYSAHGDAYIPVEFAVAAYRFGHSMVRPSYSLNSVVIKGTSEFQHNGKKFPFARIPIFVAKSKKPTDAMNGFGEELPNSWGIDWDFFLGKIGTHMEPKPQIPQPSYRIDASLVDPLGDLPEFVAQNVPSPFASLAFRNLMRGVSMGLPAGQRIAKMMGVPHLTDEELWTKKNEGEKIIPWTEGRTFFDAHKKWLEFSAPLWFYILKEAEIKHHGHHLGSVGSRIVAETFYGLAWSDHYSYIFQMPNWKPDDEFQDGTLVNLDLLKLTQFVG